MTLIDFLKDRRASIAVHLLTATTVTAIITVLSSNLAIGTLVAVVLLAGIAASLTIEYVPRAEYYRELLTTVSELERTNLMAEVTAPPRFHEGRISHEALRIANKAMLDEVATHRRRDREYREYIELWIHEIKTPIASARLIAENHPSQATDSMRAEIERIGTLVEQTLFYARSNSVEKDFLIREVPLSSVVNPALQQNSRAFIERRIGLDVGELDTIVFTDVKWAAFIVSQILANAVAFAPAEDPLVRIESRVEAQSVVLTISDNGCGILTGELSRVFDKGFTGTNGRRNTRSTGLGLYMVRKLADRIELGVEIDSVVELGTTVTLRFPVSAERPGDLLGGTDLSEV